MSVIFKVGDVVVLKSGGPYMTIEVVSQESQAGGPEVYCKWFSGDDVKSDTFKSDMLNLRQE